MRHFAFGSLFLLTSVQLALCATIEVVVGGPGVLKFTPPSVNANEGDVIRFVFQQKNHTVTQSTLDSPCTPLANGFDTGYMPVPDTQKSDFPIAELTIRRTTPIWAYCRQGTHCKAGMVFAVNPGDQLAAFQAAATGGSTASASASATATTATAPSTSSSAVPSSRDHKVIVGGTGVLAFNPPNITAQVGDTITFEFRQKNHTVTASSFEAPCRDLLSATGQAGFDSGYVPVGNTTTTPPTYIVQVNDTKPIWAFCKQGNHCGQGMVFAANTVESGSKNFAAFQALAKQLNGSSSTTTPPDNTTPPTTSSSWRPVVKSSSIAVVLALSVGILLF
jgi:plastocyanin